MRIKFIALLKSDQHPQNKITIVGNPSLGEVKTMMLGVRNNSADIKSGEVWINELRLKEHNNSGGWAANANLNSRFELKPGEKDPERIRIFLNELKS